MDDRSEKRPSWRKSIYANQIVKHCAQWEIDISLIGDRKRII